MNNDNITNYFQSFVNNKKIPQALLIESSPDDYSSLAIALNILKYISCIGHNKSCEQCNNCIQIDNLTSPDIKIIFPDITGNSYDNSLCRFVDLFKHYNGITKFTWQSNINSDNKQLIISKDIINDVIAFMSLAPTQLKYRTTIIWLAEYMNINAANSLLKILEEPHHSTLFIFITNDTSRLLKTILSRLVKIKLPPITTTHDDTIEIFMEWMRLCFTLNFAKLIKFIEEISKRNKDDIVTFLCLCTEYLNDILLLQCDLERDIGNKEMLQRLSRFLDYPKIQQVLEILSKTSYKITRNTNAKITMFCTSIDINKIFNYC